MDYPKTIRFSETVPDTAINFDTLGEATGAGLWHIILINADVLDIDNTVTWSRTFRMMLGFNDETEFPNQMTSWVSRIHHADKERVLQALTTHLADHSGRTCFNVEYRLRVKDGHYVWFRSTGTTGRESEGMQAIFIGSLFNIHAQKIKAQETEFMLTRFQLISRVLTEGPWDMKVVAGDPVNPRNEFWWSPQFRQILGFKDEYDFPNVLSSWSERLHPEDKEKTLQALFRHLTDHTGQTPYAIDYRLRLKNGEYRWFHAHGVTDRDEHGLPLRVAGTIRDIEHEKQKNIASQEKLSRYCEIINTLTTKQRLKSQLILISPEMAKLTGNIEKFAKVDSPVLITGESGVGKEVVADMLHNLSDRQEAPFFKINCGAIPEPLLESELFGYEEGAFTGAKRGGKMGFFELADNGTILLDEIGDLPVPLQVKILRFVQSRDFFRIGGKRLIQVNTRIIAATNRRLEAMVANKEFRADLYYRLNVLTLDIPALRERPGDILPLTQHFLKRYNEKYHTNKTFSPEVFQAFKSYPWPGNVRELENLIERLVVTCENNVIAKDCLPDVMKNHETPAITSEFVNMTTYKEAKEQFERQYFAQAINTYGSTRKTAEKIKVDHSTIVKKAAKYNINLFRWHKE